MVRALTIGLQYLLRVVEAFRLLMFMSSLVFDATNREAAGAQARNNGLDRGLDEFYAVRSSRIAGCGHPRKTVQANCPGIAGVVLSQAASGEERWFLKCSPRFPRIFSPSGPIWMRINNTALCAICSTLRYSVSIRAWVVYGFALWIPPLFG